MKLLTTGEEAKERIVISMDAFSILFMFIFYGVFAAIGWYFQRSIIISALKKFDDIKQQKKDEENPFC